MERLGATEGGRQRVEMGQIMYRGHEAGRYRVAHQRLTQKQPSLTELRQLSKTAETDPETAVTN